MHAWLGSGEVYCCVCRCTIDWFLPWPEEALTEVAGKYIDEFPMACPDPVRNFLLTSFPHALVTHS